MCEKQEPARMREVKEFLCGLTTHVAVQLEAEARQRHGFLDEWPCHHASDCFCGENKVGHSFNMSGEVLTFIREAVDEKLQGGH